MKSFLIILIFVFLSAAACDDIMPSKYFSFHLKSIKDLIEISNDIIECIKTKINFIDEELSEKEFDEIWDNYFKERSENPIFWLSEEAVTQSGVMFCDSHNATQETFLREFSKNLTLDNDLDCLKFHLKRIQPENEIVKHFNKNITCELDPYFEFTSKYKLESSKKLPLTKCSLDDFVQPNRMIAMYLETFIKAKTSNEPSQEIDEKAKNIMRDIADKQLKCLLDQIYDR